LAGREVALGYHLVDYLLRKAFVTRGAFRTPCILAAVDILSLRVVQGVELCLVEGVELHLLLLVKNLA
jgi:hypothetical protein